jgi:hypothetical protein
MTHLRLMAALFVVAGSAAIGSASATTQGSVKESACAAHVSRGVLPAWARTGFSEPTPRITHVLGASGDIAGILFGFPLYSPPLANRSNKILWVSRRPTRSISDLRVHAQRMIGSARVGKAITRTVAGGPGPSIIDLPAPGCWRLTLRWSGRVDSVELQYLSRR